MAPQDQGGNNGEREDRSIFPFEKLAPELRNKVYEYALPPGTEVGISRHRSDKVSPFRLRQVTMKEVQHYNGDISLSRGTACRDHRLAIVCLNKLTYCEALPILYGNSVFIFADFPALNQFLEQTSYGLELIKHVRMLSWLRKDMTNIMHKFKEMRALQTLEISGTVLRHWKNGYAENTYFGIRVPGVIATIGPGVAALIREAESEHGRHTLLSKIKFKPSPNALMHVRVDAYMPVLRRVGEAEVHRLLEEGLKKWLIEKGILQEAPQDGQAPRDA